MVSLLMILIRVASRARVVLKSFQRLLTLLGKENGRWRIYHHSWTMTPMVWTDVFHVVRCPMIAAQGSFHFLALTLTFNRVVPIVIRVLRFVVHQLNVKVSFEPPHPLLLLLVCSPNTPF